MGTLRAKPGSATSLTRAVFFFFFKLPTDRPFSIYTSHTTQWFCLSCNPATQPCKHRSAWSHCQLHPCSLEDWRGGEHGASYLDFSHRLSPVSLGTSRTQRPKTRFGFCFPATHVLSCSSSVAPSVLSAFSECHPGELFSLTFYASTRCHLKAEKFTSRVRSILFMPSWCLPLALNPDSLHISSSHPSFRLKGVKNRGEIFVHFAFNVFFCFFFQICTPIRSAFLL